MFIPIYGALGIQFYGMTLCLGLGITIWLITRDKIAQEYPGISHILTIISGSTYAGLIGARLLNYITEYAAYPTMLSILYLWEAGYDSWGAVIGAVSFIICYGAWYHLTILRILDIAGQYAPLIHSITRIGCFVHGCCGGIYSAALATTLPWLNMTHHPTQLYSSGLFFLLFIVQQTVSRATTHTPGKLFLIYMIGMSSERFFIDFWRNDRIFCTYSSYMSIPQIIALGSIIISCIVWYFYRSPFWARNHEYI